MRTYDKAPKIRNGSCNPECVRPGVIYHFEAISAMKPTYVSLLTTECRVDGG